MSYFLYSCIEGLTFHPSTVMSNPKGGIKETYKMYYIPVSTLLY